MASGLSARVVIVCAVMMTASATHAQVPTEVPADRQVSERRVVAVIDLSADPAAVALADELFNALVNHVDLRPLTNPNFVQSLKGPFVDEERSYLDTAMVSKTRADEALAQLDWRSAELAAETGTTALQNVRPTPEVLGLYAELAFAAGHAALRLRKPNDASLAFGLSYRLDSAKRPDPARYEPDIVEAYQLAATRIPIPAKLEVKGSGIVWIDGVDRGAPTVFDVSTGLHLVQLSGPERETRGRQVGVQQSAALEIEAAPASPELKVARARIELAHTQDAAARAGAVKKLAQLLGVGDAVLIEVGDAGKLRVQTWRNREPGFSKMVDHGSEPAADLLVPLAPPHKIVPVKPPEPDPFPPFVVDKPFYRKNWFYGTVAVGVVAAAITIYVAATQQRDIRFMSDVKPVGE